MTPTLHLRRHLYAALPGAPRRGRRALRRQIALLDTRLPPGEDGSSGVREPRRPLPPGPQSTSAL